MKLAFAGYELEQRHAVLLRLTDLDGEHGYSDLHPWQDLGDKPAKTQLDLLKNNQCSAQLYSSLERAVLDMDFRRQKKMAMEGIKVPESHFLWSGSTEFPGRLIKYKISASFAEDTRRVLRLLELRPDVRVRLDFNNHLSEGNFSKWWEEFGKTLQAHLDFLEDPMPFDAEVWRKWREKTGVAFALDRARFTEFREFSAYDVMVLKPAVAPWGRWLGLIAESENPIVVTSYLEHPIGKVQAAYRAAQLLQSHPERLGVCGVRCALSTDGFGFGFQSEMDVPEWINLNDQLEFRRLALVS